MKNKKNSNNSNNTNSDNNNREIMLSNNTNSDNNNREIMLKEIDLVQSCINRMAQNSFTIKGWSLALNGIVIGLVVKEESIIPLVVCIVFGICFWALDAFFLRTEKMYRWKYEWIIKKRSNTVDYAYDLNPEKKEMWLPKIKNSKGNTPEEIPRKKPFLIRIMFTKTLWPLYLTIIFANIALIVYFSGCMDDISTLISSSQTMTP